MNKEYSFDIDKNVFNVFSSSPLPEIIAKYNIGKYYYLDQIHSNIINIVRNDYQTNTKGDGMVTNLKNVGLVIRTADCIPIVLYDSRKKVLAVVHSGWKGTLNEIVKDAVLTMIDNYQVEPHNIKAYLYPSIQKCHFEVDEDVYLQFENKFNNINRYYTKKETKYYIDLPSIVINSLNEVNVTNVSKMDICTYCNHDTLHSYRYDHTDKRNYLVAMIKE